MMEKYIRAILDRLDPNPHGKALAGTPKRVEEMLKYVTQGYHQDAERLIQTSLYPSPKPQLIMIKDIEFYSICEHHLLPFFGKCHIAYVPEKHILGLSKFGEIVDIYARRLQIQENLCAEIADCIEANLCPQGVAVIIEAEHLCMKMQGIQKQGAYLYTQVQKGVLAESNHWQANLFAQMTKT